MIAVEMKIRNFHNFLRYPLYYIVIWDSGFRFRAALPPKPQTLVMVRRRITLMRHSLPGRMVRWWLLAGQDQQDLPAELV
jgi:hypothetical protein